ncbi:hypothetical protein QYE76_004641 [Lolium multiflorum]|uniref:Transposase (putative) gypsy type domain-containing protein n=1 Tax=Lolium multiflorum TaxID=4521 RepID=A0AAD8RV16_LOLMU|nr:hypothetical protein QYE76_004641 [Lolium multiflorum]
MPGVKGVMGPSAAEDSMAAKLPTEEVVMMEKGSTASRVHRSIEVCPGDGPAGLGEVTVDPPEANGADAEVAPAPTWSAGPEEPDPPLTALEVARKGIEWARITNAAVDSMERALGRDWSRVDFIVRLRLGCNGNSAASSPAPDLTVLDGFVSAVASSGHIAVPSGSSAVVGEVVRPFLVTAGVVGALFARHCFISGDLLANLGDRSRPELSAVRQPSARQAGATGPRGSTLRSSPPRSPPVRSGSSSPFDLNWSSSSSSSSMASASGSWRGSLMNDDDIERLVRLRRIPREVVTRAPGDEVEPRPDPGERVVFGAHLDRGLGLPASAFFRRFLDFFGLQPHHLPANACVLLSCYVAFMEGYAGLWPDVDFWGRLFYLKSQMTEGRLRTCGCASIYPRAGSLFPKIPTVDSVKNWQMTFFYVKNANPAFDRINLPEYDPAPPTTRLNWGHNPKSADPDAEVNLLWDFLGECVQGGRLSAEDLLCTYMERRVIPLQARAHKIGLMSGRLDPTRTSRVALTKAQVAHRVNNVTKANLPEDWAWGLPPYDRAAPPERIFPRQELEDGDLAHKIWTADLVDPADQVGDQAGDQAGDDDLPVVPDQGGQGEHNPPPSPEQQEEEEAEPATSTTGPGPIRAVPCAEAACRLGDFRAEEEAGRRREHGQAGGQGQEAAPAGAQEGPPSSSPKAAAGPAARVAPPFRRQREPTPPPTTRARTPPVVVVPPVVTPPQLRRLPRSVLFGCASFSATAGRSGRVGPGPTLGDLFPRRCWGRLLEPAAMCHRRQGAGGAAPPEGLEVVPTGPAAPPPASEPPRAEQQEEGARGPLPR